RPFPRGLVLGVPTDLAALARSGIVPARSAGRAALDLLLPGPRWEALAERAAAGGPDPTIAEVVLPRLGREVLASLVDPLLGGINAGDSAVLSFAAAAPTLAARLGRRASLVRSLRDGRVSAPRSGAASGSPAGGAPSAAGGAGPATHRGESRASGPIFLGLERGLASLVERLEQACRSAGVSIRRSSALDRIRRNADGRGYVLDVAGGDQIESERVVLALPAAAAGAALASLAPDLAAECTAIPAAGVALVTAAFDAAAVGARPQGSGALVPRDRGTAVTALTFVSTKWPRSAAAGEVVVRASLGRHGDDATLELDDETLAQVALDGIAAVAGICGQPLDVLVQRWPASFPQYVSGHLARVARIERLCEGLPGLALAGAAYRGIGIPACVEDGRRAAAHVGSLTPR
ncbi:MAG TPA: protoporphyrinogen oxidase, partial [Acidimicrobiales bacterium]|nr:protoporphyrinogen oxidase [Acidimicrobiales bacterium]